MIFVTTGTFGFARLIETVDKLAGAGLLGDAAVAQIGHSPYVPKHMEYFRTSVDIRRYMDDARYVISHGGTGSMIELIGMGKKIIGVPNHDLAENHQQVFLEKLHRDGSILYAPEPDEKLLLAQIGLIDTFQPAPFSFYPSTFIERLRQDVFQR